MTEKQIECILNEYGERGPEYVPIKEMWESYTGWYWFITEYADKDDPDYCFGYVIGLENEWGYIDKSELRSIPGVWKVPKVNWSSNSHVKLVEMAEVKTK